MPQGFIQEVISMIGTKRIIVADCQLMPLTILLLKKRFLRALPQICENLRNLKMEKELILLPYLKDQASFDCKTTYWLFPIFFWRFYRHSPPDNPNFMSLCSDFMQSTKIAPNTSLLNYKLRKLQFCQKHNAYNTCASILTFLLYQDHRIHNQKQKNREKVSHNTTVLSRMMGLQGRGVGASNTFVMSKLADKKRHNLILQMLRRKIRENQSKAYIEATQKQLKQKSKPFPVP